MRGWCQVLSTLSRKYHCKFQAKHIIQNCEISLLDTEIPEQPAKGAVFWRTKEKNRRKSTVRGVFPSPQSWPVMLSGDDICVSGRRVYIHMAVKGWKSQPLESCWWQRVREPGAACPVPRAWGFRGLAGQRRLGNLGDWGYSTPAQFTQFGSIPVPHLSAKALVLWARSPSKGGTVLSGWGGQVAQRTLGICWNEGRAEWSVSFPGFTNMSILPERVGSWVQLPKIMSLTYLVTLAQAKRPCPLAEVLAHSPFCSFYKVWTPNSVSPGQ